MAYYYFDSKDIVSTTHNSDVYLVANVGNYHDYNGRDISFGGFNLKGGTKFSLGGTYHTGEIDLDKISVWNIYQKINNRSGGNAAAISFDGNGTFIINSQMGASDGAKHDDRDVTIHAYQFIACDSRFVNYSYLPALNPDPKYEIKGQIADISGVYAKINLTVGSHFNGTIKVEGYHTAFGIKDPTAKTLTNTTINTSSLAAGLRGDGTVKFKGNFYGSIDSSEEVHLQTTNKQMLNNTVGAYGVYAKGDLEHTSVWSGKISTKADYSTLNATVALQYEATPSSANGTLEGNTIESIGIKAANISLAHLDYKANNDHASTTIQFITDNGANFDMSNAKVGTTAAKDKDIKNISVDQTAKEPDFYYVSISDKVYEDLADLLSNNWKLTISDDSNVITDLSVLKVELLENSAYVSGNGNEPMIKIPTNGNDKIEALIGAIEQKNFSNWKITAKKDGDTKTFTLDEDVRVCEDLPKELTLTWTGGSVLSNNGQYILVPTDGTAPLVINKADVTITGNTCEYTIQGADKVKKYLDKSFSYYEYDQSNPLIMHDVTSQGAKFYYISSSANTPDISFSYNLDSSDLSKFPSISGTASTTQSYLSHTQPTYLGNGLYLHTFEDIQDKFKIRVPLDKEIIIHAEAENNEMKVDGNASPAADYMNDNKIQAVGIEAEEKVEIRNFTEGSVIEVAARFNKINSQIPAGADKDNMIAAVGIKGKTVQLHDFNGTINVTATDNKIQHENDSNNQRQNSLVFTGIEANTLNVSKNLYGTFNITASGNTTPWTTGQNSTRGDWYLTADVHSSSQDAITAGIFADNMNVDGFIESNINVYANNGTNTFSAGIYATETLDAKGFSGSITVIGNRTMTFGIYAKTFDSEIGYYFDTYNYSYTSGSAGRLAYARDIFNVEGDITVTGSDSLVCAIATCDVANLYLNGNIYSSRYAVKTDYSKNVSTGFNNDWVTLGANADVTGSIDLGGGKNRLTFDSSAKFYGYVVHDVGTTNITYQLNGAARTGAIHTVNYECDATLVSGTTITIDCNKIAIGDKYTLIDYDNSYKIADDRWLNSYVTVSYQGKNSLVYIKDGISDIVALNGNDLNGDGKYGNNEKFYVRLVYDQNSNKLSFESAADSSFSNPENIVKPASNIAVVSFNPLAQKPEDKVIVSIPNMESTFIAAMKNLNNGAEPNYVTYDIDEVSRTATADTTIYWMCEAGNYKNASYEVEYTINDAQGNAVSTAVLRLTTVNENNKTFSGTVKLNGYTQDTYGSVILVNDAGKTQEQILKEDPSGNTPFNGKYYIMSYNINSIPEGYTVGYKVRDFVSEGTQVTDWVEGSITTQVQDFTSTISAVDPNGMFAVNPDTQSLELTDGKALFTWNAAAGNYPVEKYTVQYFFTTENLSNNAEKRQILFDAYTYADKTNNTWQEVKDKSGNVIKNDKGYAYEICLVKGNGNTPETIHIRETISVVNVFGKEQKNYVYYNFVSKEVTSTELLATGLPNESYVYWRIQATSSGGITDPATGVVTYPVTEWTEGNFTGIGVDNSINTKPEGGDDDDLAETDKVPVGAFTTLNVPTVVPEFNEIPIGSTTVDGETIVETEKQFVSADITFSWTDTFTATSDNAEIAYVFQVSDSQDFNSARTETILLLSSSISEATAEKIYINVAEKYSYYDENGVKHYPLTVFNGIDSWRVSSGESYTTTVTFDNSYPSIPVGMFANPTNYWQIKAVDTYGNEAEYCNVQSFKPTYTIKETYTEVNPETGKLEVKERDVVKSITDLAPAKAYALAIETPEQEDNKNTGKIELTFKTDHTNMGIDKICITIEGKDVGGKKLPTDVITLDTFLTTSYVENSTLTEFKKELKDVITVDGVIVQEQNLADGTYTVYVTTYNSHGAKTNSDKYTFIQDTTRPVIQTAAQGNGTTISANVTQKTESPDRIMVTVSWPIATDNFDTKSKSNIKGYYLWYKATGTSEWQAVRINDSTLLTKTSYDITLTNGSKYDFKVVAVDKNNNQSDPVESNGIEIYYTDIDDSYTPVFPPEYAPVSVTNEVIGGSVDPSDKIHVYTDNNTQNAGRMIFTVKNLKQLRGTGNAITISLYEDDGGLTLLKTYTVKGTSDAKSSAGLSFEYLLPESGKQYVFEVKAANGTTVMSYDFDYQFVYFAKDKNNDTAYQLASDYVVDFHTDRTSKDVAEDPSGNLKSFDVSLEGSNNAKKLFAGYGDAVNYNRLTITTDGKYTFSISKDEKDSLSNITVNIYQATAGSTALKSVKSITVAANKTEGVIKDLELAAGDYIIQVTSPNAAKGANINYSINVSSQNDKYYLYTNNDDDSYAAAPATVSALNENTDVIFGTVQKTAEGEISFYTEFIGKTDLTDFRKITVNESGICTFSLQKFTYFNTVQEKELAFGENGALTFTIYQLVEGKTALQKVKSLSIAAKDFEKELETYLAKGEYYIEVKASSAKTALDYFVTMEQQSVKLNNITYVSQGNFNIDDNVIYSKTVTDEIGKVYYFNKETYIEEQKNTYEFIGYDETRNYFKVTFEKNGDYTFSVNTYDDRGKGKENSLAVNFSALKAVIYKANADGSGFTAVKTISLANNKSTASAQIKNLAAGEYFIEITASNAAAGKYALYNLSVKTDYVVNASQYDASAKEFADFTKAENYTVGTLQSNINLTADKNVHYYKFETGSVTGKYNFSFGNEGTYKVYVLKDGAVKLTEIKPDKELAAYLDANATVYIAASTKNTNVNASFSVVKDATLAKDIAQYTNDNTAAAAEAVTALTVNETNKTGSFTSWVGYGDLESWRKLVLDEAGSFNLSLDKLAQAADSAMTVTIYQFTNNGTSPKSVGSFTVKAGSLDGMKNFMLAAGEYYIQVKTTTAKGNVDFTLTVDGDTANDKKCFIAKADNSDDTIINDKYISAAGGTITNEWVGYSDEYDFFNIEVAKSGYYDFTFSNSDAAQVTLYVVNPANSKLSSLATYTAKTAGNQTVFVDKNGNTVLLNSNSQYIAMVKSTNASKGGNCDYSFTAAENQQKHLVRFTVSAEEAGKYTFVDASATFTLYDFTIEKYNSATGKTSVVKLNSSDQLTLAAGDYFLTSTRSDIETLRIDIDDNSKLVTIK